MRQVPFSLVDRGCSCRVNVWASPFMNNSCPVLSPSVVIGTPIDLRRVIEIRKPAVRVAYDLDVLPGSPTLAEVLAPVLS